MNIKTLHTALPYLFKAKVTPLIVGESGIGKSQAIKQYADANGLDFIDLRLGQMADAGDLLGLLDFVKDSKTGQSVSSRHMRPAFLPTSGKGILFLDEVNRANRDILQAIFQLILDHKIHEYELPEGWHVVAACNPPSADYITTDIGDQAMIARFCQIRLETPVADWLDHARSQAGMSDSITGFIVQQPDMLDGKNAEFALYPTTPRRRSWEMVSKLTEQNPPTHILQELAAGLVGLEAAIAYTSFLKTFDVSLKAEDVLEHYEERVKPRLPQLTQRLDILIDAGNQVVNAIKKIYDEEDKKREAKGAAYVENDPISETWVKNIKQFLLDTPDEFSYAQVREVLRAGLWRQYAEDKELIEHFSKIVKSGTAKKVLKEIKEREEAKATEDAAA